MPALIEALKDEDRDVKKLAGNTLRKIGPEAKEAVPALIEALKDEGGWVRNSAAKALEKINTPEAQKALADYKKQSD